MLRKKSDLIWSDLNLIHQIRIRSYIFDLQFGFRSNKYWSDQIRSDSDQIRSRSDQIRFNLTKSESDLIQSDWIWISIIFFLFTNPLFLDFAWRLNTFLRTFFTWKLRLEINGEFFYFYFIFFFHFSCFFFVY